MSEQEIEIILIDDSAEDADLSARALRKYNIANKFVTFTTGNLALEYLFGSLNSVPRLILLDLNMPGMHGLDFIRSLKADDRTKDIPIVVLTGSTELPDIKESLRTRSEILYRQTHRI